MLHQALRFFVELGIQGIDTDYWFAILTIVFLGKSTA